MSNLLGQHCEDKVYEIVDEQPQFPGGLAEMYKYLSRQHWPEIGDSDPVVSKFYFRYTVGCDGKIYDVCALVHPDHPVSIMYVEAIKEMPLWIPGKIDGTPVNVEFILPLLIHLE